MKSTSGSHTTSAALALALSAAACCHAQVILSDDFSDGDRTAPPWYYAYGAAAPESATVDTNGSMKNLRLAETVNNNGQVWTTFPATTLQVGQTLKVFLRFDVAGGLGSGGDFAMRAGLFDIASPVNADLPNTIGNAAWADARGYAAFIRCGITGNPSGPDSTFRQRTGTNNTLWAAAASSTVVPTTVSGTANIVLGSSTDLSATAPRYSLEYSVTRRAADAMDFSCQVADANGVIQRMAGGQDAAVHTSFNTFSLFTGTIAAKAFVMDDFSLAIANPGVVITSVAKGEGTFTLSWNSGGLPVVIERSATMEDGSWIPVSNTNLDGTFTDPEAPAGKAFYRIRVEIGPPV